MRPYINKTRRKLSKIRIEHIKIRKPRQELRPAKFLHATFRNFSAKIRNFSARSEPDRYPARFQHTNRPKQEKERAKYTSILVTWPRAPFNCGRWLTLLRRGCSPHQNRGRFRLVPLLALVFWDVALNIPKYQSSKGTSRKRPRLGGSPVVLTLSFNVA